jgi:etoposide-induced 2.4 mRNA
MLESGLLENALSKLRGSDLEIRSNAFKSLLLNLLCLASIYGLDFVLLPALHVRRPLDGDAWLHRNFGTMYQVLFVMPVVGLSLYLNVRIQSSLSNVVWKDSMICRVHGVKS